jgi:general secretion pathway protein D
MNAALNRPLMLACIIPALLLPLSGCKSLLEKGVAATAIDQAYERGQKDFRARLEAPLAEERGERIPPEGFAAIDNADPGDVGLEEEAPKIYAGTGKFLGASPVRADEMEVGDITLNFENTDIREVTKIILGDLLGFNYLLAPGVKGAVSVFTAKPLTKSVLLPTLETLLRMNGAALVYADGIYRVVPVAAAVKGVTTPQLGELNMPIPSNYSVRIVPLEFVAVTEMGKILEPLAPEGSIIRADVARNLLVIAGTSPELAKLLDTIKVFDVDWMKGVSVGFFPLQYASVEDITKDLQQIFGDPNEGPLAGVLRVFPVRSGNGLLVVTPQKRYLEEAAKWIDRFDRMGGDGSEARLYVYRVRNGEAEDLAGLLNDLFSESGSSKKKTTAAQVAPGQTAATVQSKEKRATAAKAKPAAGSATSPASMAASGSLSDEVKFVADPRNNSLLIMATPRDYRHILTALEQLDVMPLQVLVEATIVEIQLKDSLEYGIQWFFKMNHGDLNSEVNWDGTIDGASSAGLGKMFPGFNWAMVAKNILGTGDNGIRGVLSAFADEGLVRVLSSPSVMVLDNQTARIQVGDEVPIATSQQQSTTTDANIVNSISYRDTGVVLEVTPRVNPGGLVTMEVRQEVSSARTSESSSLDSPTIATREVTSTVAVQSDQTVVLGGLIRDDTENTRGGVPGLYNLPVVGWLFGQDSSASTRTELVVILTPSVIMGEKDIRAVTEDFRSRLKGLEGRF